MNTTADSVLTTKEVADEGENLTRTHMAAILQQHGIQNRRSL